MAYSKSILQWRELTIETEGSSQRFVRRARASEPKGWCAARTLHVRYDSDWLNGKSRGHQIAHLELETIKPKRAANPITETGYRSYFTSKEEVESYGGPAELVKYWLDLEAKTDKWQQHEMDQKQMCLF